MRLGVKHKTVYRYEPARRMVIQSLRLTPATTEAQTIVEWTIDVPDGLRGAGFTDGAGDWIETVTVPGPVEELIITVEGVVETQDTTGLLRRHRERVDPIVYLRDTRFTTADDAIRALANEAVSGVAGPLPRAHALMNAVRDRIAYEPGRTDPATTAAEALSAKAGVCQDHAHVMIAAAMCLDIPARYVTGYLHAEGDIAEASHAWAELHVDDLGWVGFDASNGVCPDERYIRVGSGFDALDAAPIRGVSQGVGGEVLDVDVTVIEQAQ